MAGTLLLAIESAIDGGSLSVFHGTTELASEVNNKIASAEELLPLIERLLKTGGANVGDLGSIAVSAGPGSFTGIRIGLATAMGLRDSLGLRLATVSALNAMSVSVTAQRSTVAVPMGRGGICFQSFNGERILPPKAVEERTFVDHLLSDPDSTFVLHGSLISRVPDVDNVVDAGRNIAALIAKYCQDHPDESTSPLFISKN